MNTKITWPGGKQFAFTVFDDADCDRFENTRPVYDFLGELGFRTTKSVWPLASAVGPTELGGTSCEDPAYLAWVQGLQRDGFEIGFHNARCHSSRRQDTEAALDGFKKWFGHDPRSMANHFQNQEAIYWGGDRLTGLCRQMYRLLSLHRRRPMVYEGHVPGSPYFWGDLCRDRIRYVRNFVFREINTLKVCPWMPYHDPALPFVNAWYASAEGNHVHLLNETLGEANQDRLIAEGGACIAYTHFGKKFYDQGRINPRFRGLMQRLSRQNGWFVPLAELLDHLAAHRGGTHVITPAERRRLQWRWMATKLRHGSS